MTTPRAVRPGAASLALLVILLITAAWWALALWPAGDVPPEWLARTRAACFGAPPGGLPDAGGWILLIGEPLGMLGVLLVVWGDALKQDLVGTRTGRRWRLVGASLALMLLAGAGVLVRRVSRAMTLGAAERVDVSGAPTRIDTDASWIALTDQSGRRTSPADFHGGPLLLTFAYGHCATVCPLVVHETLAARRQAGRPDVPLVVVTVDPWRDTPERLPGIATEWGLGPGDRVLSGGIDEVERTLDRLGIGRRRDERTGDIEHAGTVLVLDRRGHAIWRLDGGWWRLPELLASR